MTLIAEYPPRAAASAGAVFATPAIVHFSAVLFLSAILRAPWHTIIPVAVLWGVSALIGFVYIVRVICRMCLQTAYKPGFEDWCFHAVLPLVTYATLGCSALAAVSRIREALFGVGAAALMLLFIGIHNAWDAIGYHVLVNERHKKDSKR